MKIKFENESDFCAKLDICENFEAECDSFNPFTRGIGKPMRIRCYRWDDKHVFVFKPRSRKWGYLWSIPEFIQRATCIFPEEKSEAVAWERRMKNVIKRLDKSGLWPDVKTELESVLKAGYENRDNWREIHNCITKSMWFGKFYNAIVKEEIADALANDREYYNRVQAGYDVSFQYDPKTKHAWYSEEYRGCGNGHYYIAIDGNMALYVEDD